ncbi:substrate-binding periplasmic protein [Pontibacter sp. JAM-7]|uniref:substrate-binding periplasmic protein n=1 Tax=Pontibacter sp. JAM-7 TaxID=3366581 RepID=UPI003AF4D8CD
MSKELFKTAILLCASLLSSLAHSRYYDDVISSGYIRIGVYKDFPPFSFEQNGKPAGVDVEIGKQIAKELGVKLQVHWITPDENLEDDLRNNVWKGHYLDKDEDNPMAMKTLADVMMRVPYDREFSYMRDSTGALINEEVVMFGPYQSERWQVVYDSRKMKHVTTIAVFQYHPIGVEIDSLPSFYMTSAAGGRMRDKTKHYTNAAAAYEGLENGEVSAVMAMRSEIDWLLFSRPQSAYKLGENSYPAMGKQQWDLGMAIKQSYRQLGYAVEDIVDKMVRSGDMETVFQKYGLRYEKPAFYQEIAH